MHGKFFTFPLCVLAMPLDEKTILQHIVSHRARTRWRWERCRKNLPPKILAYVIEHENIGYSQSARHDQFIRGAIITNVKLGWINTTINECDAANRFVAEHERKHGKDPLVFIAAELFWSCHDDNQDFSFREFSTACAVNSVIGFKKTPVIIRRSMIQARQLGYKTPLVMAAELPEANRKRPDKRKPLSVQQLRDTLDNLEKRDLFRRCQPGRRTVYFSTTLDLAELRAAVKERVEKRSKVQLRRQLDREMFAKPGGNQSGTNQEPLKKETGKTGENRTTKGGTNQEPNGSQTETTDGTTSGTTKINAPVINAPLTKAFKEERGNGESALAKLVGSIARSTTASSYPEGGEPSLEAVRKFMDEFIRGAGEYAEEWVKRMKQQAWKDHKGQPVKDWKKLAASWVSGCERRKTLHRKMKHLLARAVASLKRILPC